MKLPNSKPFWAVIFETDDFIAVNKASGIAVAGDRWQPSKERLDRLLAASLGLEKIFVVHRIDSGTSGLVLFAKNALAHKELCGAFERREVEKRYIAVVHGKPSWKETCCDLPLLACANKKHDTIVERFRGKPSRTRFAVIAAAGRYAVIEAFPETGRQHQIRVHLCALGHPVVCDERYGKPEPVYLSSFKRGWRGERGEERPLLARLGLHAASLVLPAGIGDGIYAGIYAEDGGGLALSAPPPKDLKAAMNQIKSLRVC